MENKKEIEYLVVTRVDKGDELGNSVGKYYAEFEFAFNGLKDSFKTSVNRGRLGKEPYDCDGISEVDAKKIIKHYKNNSEETNFKI